MVIPPGYYAETKTSLSEIAHVTGLPAEQLLAANAGVVATVDQTLENILLAVPRLYIVHTEMPLANVAELLDTEVTNLSAANPDLIDTELLSAGTVLIRPVK